MTSRLDMPSDLHAEVLSLRQKRLALLGEVKKRRWRLHRLPNLQRDLEETTRNLMRAELKLKREGEQEDGEKRLMWWQRD